MATVKGPINLDMNETALICIEFQNEFTNKKGKAHAGVKAVMESTDMMAKTVDLAAKIREAGGKIMHVPIMFEENHEDSPNSSHGVLAGLKAGKLFTQNTEGSTLFDDEMLPEEGDITITGKRGLSSWPNTTLEAECKANNIKNIVICGFLTNCCVESTMRDGYEKGYNVITVPDCCAAIGQAAHDAAVKHTFPMFSTPMSKAEFETRVLNQETFQPVVTEKMEN